MPEQFDAIVIGAGQSGPFLMAQLAKAGMKVVLIERKQLGGTCVNTGCMPTKTLVASARAAYMVRRAADFGVHTEGLTVDMKRVHERAATVSANARKGLEDWLGASVIYGEARFVGPRVVRVNGRELTAPKIFINVGTRPARPALRGIDSVRTLDNADMIAMQELPKHLVVVGGSVIGIEFAQMYRRFGAQVTIVEKGPRLLAREDVDVSDAIADMLRAEGIGLRLHAECIGFAPHAEGVEVGVSCHEGAPSVVGSHALLAVGRTPNTDTLGLEQTGVKVDARGYVEVDDTLSAAEGIWALGDCNGRGAFTHTSYNDHEIVADNLLRGGARKVSDRLPTYAVYCDPPLGRVGMTETEARQSGRKLLIAKRPMARVGRAVERDETTGFMKVIVDADSKQILGASILGIEGDEAIHSITTAMYAKAPYTLLTHAVFIHPTVSELLPTVFGDLQPA
jgi:pyruvate/2-oxoglutarate dehydrogenase complex dihydrolipoamide dehydrogenase (E3) component